MTSQSLSPPTGTTSPGLCKIAVLLLVVGSFLLTCYVALFLGPAEDGLQSVSQTYSHSLPPSTSSPSPAGTDSRDDTVQSATANASTDSEYVDSDEEGSLPSNDDPEECAAAAATPSVPTAPQAPAPQPHARGSLAAMPFYVEANPIPLPKSFLDRSPQLQKVDPSRYSSVRCSGTLRHRDGNRFRTCTFRNVCIDKRKPTELLYYRRPTAPKPQVFYVNETDQTSFPGEFIYRCVTEKYGTWAPTTVSSPMPKSAPVVEPPHLLAFPFACHNNLHILWDNVMHWYIALRLAFKLRPDVQVMVTPVVDPYTRLGRPCFGFMRNWWPFAAPRTVTDIIKQHLGKEKKQQQVVCFKDVVVGHLSHLLTPDDRDTQHGVEAILFDYRAELLRKFGLDPLARPTRHRIILTDKKTANAYNQRPGMPTRRAIKNIDEVERFLRKTYPDIPVDRVVWSDIRSEKKCAAKFMDTTILISPAGSVSLKSFMLPVGACEIIMDSPLEMPSRDKPRVGSQCVDCYGHDRFSHTWKNNYQVHDASDFTLDYAEATDVRTFTSTVVKMDRLRLLVDKCLEDQASGT